MSMAIGTPQYGAKKKNNFRLQDGDNIFRILPPLGELAAEGIWAVYDSMHWGYKGSRGMRPFKCIQKKDFKTKMIKVQCPECDKIAEKTALVEDHKKSLAAQGKSPEEIAESVKPLSDWLFSHNLDKKWYLNVLTQDGKIGRLAIPHKMYTQLQEVITDLVSKQGVDPIGVEGGLWFNLVRTGKGLQTTHRVAVVEQMETINGRAMRTYKPAPLTQEVLQRVGTEAYDLKNAVKSLSFDDIQLIVKSGGDPEIVDAIFGNGEVTRSAEQAAPADDEPDTGAVASFKAAPVAAAPVAAAPVAPAPVAPAVVVAAPAVSEVDEEAALLAQLEAARAKKAAAKAAPVMSAAPAAPASGLSDDEFVKAYGFAK